MKLFSKSLPHIKLATKMKLFYSLFFIILFLENLYSQTPRRILFEEFTGAHSSACAYLNPNFDTLMASNASDVVVLKYPLATQQGQDPFYDQNSTFSDARALYYGGVAGLPQVFMDGNVLSGASPSVINQGTINNRLLTNSYISMNLSHSLHSGLDSIDISCTVQNTHTAPIFSGRKLRVAIVEKQINTPYPLGINGETVFNGLVRSMVPDAAGTTLPVIAVGSNTTVNLTAAIPSYIYNLEQIAIVAFYQNDNNKDIFQAQISEPQPLPASAFVVDASATSGTVLPTTFCTDSITPRIQVTNAHSSSINSFVAKYSFNGGVWVQQAFLDTLTIGQSTTINFPAIAVPMGNNNFRYEINSINNGVVDFNQSNNLIQKDHFFTFTSNSTDSTFAEDFQGYTSGSPMPNRAYLDNPDNHTIAIVDNTISSSVTANLGGYGNSNGCYMWDFWNMVNGENGTLIFDNRNFSNRSASTLEFSYAHAQVNSESDSLIVLVSTDCAQTWTSVFTLVGTALSTASNHASNTFYPEPNEWARAYVDLTAYNGMSDVMIAFKGVSDYGNNLFIDDINLSTIPVALVDVEQQNFALTLYPNPANEKITLSIDSDYNEAVDVQVVNMLGQSIYSGRFNQKNIHLDIQEFAKGAYFVVIKQGKYTDNQRFIVK